MNLSQNCKINMKYVIMNENVAFRLRYPISILCAIIISVLFKYEKIIKNKILSHCVIPIVSFVLIMFIIDISTRYTISKEELKRSELICDKMKLEPDKYLLGTNNYKHIKTPIKLDNNYKKMIDTLYVQENMKNNTSIEEKQHSLNSIEEKQHSLNSGKTKRLEENPFPSKKKLKLSNRNRDGGDRNRDEGYHDKDDGHRNRDGGYHNRDEGHRNRDGGDRNRDEENNNESTVESFVSNLSEYISHENIDENNSTDLLIRDIGVKINHNNKKVKHYNNHNKGNFDSDKYATLNINVKNKNKNSYTSNIREICNSTKECCLLGEDKCSPICSGLNNKCNLVAPIPGPQWQVQGASLVQNRLKNSIYTSSKCPLT